MVPEKKIYVFPKINLWEIFLIPRAWLTEFIKGPLNYSLLTKYIWLQRRFLYVLPKSL